MTIECYYNQCCFHCQDGPFCDESECRANESERNKWENERQAKLAKPEYNIPEHIIEKMSQEIKEEIDRMVLKSCQQMNDEIEDIILR